MLLFFTVVKLSLLNNETVDLTLHTYSLYTACGSSCTVGIHYWNKYSFTYITVKLFIVCYNVMFSGMSENHHNLNTWYYF